MSRDAIVALFRDFYDAAADMTLHLVQVGVQGSEDTLDDLGESLVAFGRDAYLETLEGVRPLPPRETWEEMPTFSGVFGGVFYERFGAEILAEIAD